MLIVSPSQLPTILARTAAGLICGAAFLGLAARADAQLKDVAGSKDPAGIKRYQGATIIGYSSAKFDEFTFLAGPVKDIPGKPIAEATKSERAEGQRTRLLYVVPEGRSPLEVLRNYEQELTAAGFTVVYKCAADSCYVKGSGSLADDFLYPLRARLSNYPPAGTGRPPGQVSEYAFNFAKDQRFLFAKRTGPPANAWVSIYTAIGGFDMHKDTYGHTLVLLDHVEAAPMEGKMVTVDASTMAKGIAAAGHVALYGILFDHDKSDIKPESAATVAEIAKFLKQDPKIALYVVGHTDNVGAYDYNIGLSQRRAAAVVQALTTTHGIAAARLKPAGSGPLAPVAPNDSEEGRAKNRRVELVKQ